MKMKINNRGEMEGWIGIATIIVILLFCLYRCANPQTSARSYGGDMTIYLDAGEKLEEITWKDDDLWYLTRPMREDEVAETHVFQADTVFGVFEGTVTIVEKEK